MKSRLKQSHRVLLAFIILSAATVLILFTGPGFNFVAQIILSFVLFLSLCWLIT